MRSPGPRIITQITVCAALLITAAVLVRSQKVPEITDRNFVASRMLRMQWTAMGLSFGTIGAVIITLALSRYFYGLSEFDLLAFTVSIAILAATAATACYIPAKRASQVDPMVVLRQK